VGNLISELRAGESLKKKKFKVFHQMSRDNEISEDLVLRVNSSIESTHTIKEDFQFEEHDKLL